MTEIKHWSDYLPDMKIKLQEWIDDPKTCCITDDQLQSNCIRTGCRRLVTTCADCGRVVNTKEFKKYPELPLENKKDE